jgi:hypothetical protein
MADKMTRGERTELTQLIRKREKVMKSQAAERSALLLAEFDAQSAKIHSFDDDDVWKAAATAAEESVAKANDMIARQCKKLGIPKEFAPSVRFWWDGRGHNAVASRRAELRRAAKSRIEAMETEAISKIERMSLEAQTEVLANGLETESAKKFLDAMPKMNELMPPVQIGEIQSLVDTRKTEGRSNHYELN